MDGAALCSVVDTAVVDSAVVDTAVEISKSMLFPNLLDHEFQ